MNYKLEDIDKVVALFFEKLGSKKKVFFYGEIGSGKTTLITAICRYLNIEGDLSSPSYSLINEYTYKNKQGAHDFIYHIDLYRLNDIEEALAIGIEDHLEDPYLCFIEWPQIIEPLEMEEVLKIRLSLNGDSSRKILFL